MNELNKREIRTSAKCLSVREATGGEDGNQSTGRTIEGYAIVFNEESVILDDWGMKFREIILPSCCSQEYVDSCDIKMTMFHNRELLLARSNKGEGSMRLTVDDTGVKFEFEAPNTMDGDKVLDLVARGDLSGCSFTFMPGDYEMEERESDGMLLIRHKSFAWLGEMTIGSDPAYTATTVNAREALGKPSDEVTEKQRNEQLQREADKARANAVRADFLALSEY